MKSEIKQVHVDSYDNRESSITKIKLSNGVIETVSQAVNYIDSGREYYFTTSYNTEAEVESVHPFSGTPYIKTKPNQTTRDNLLSLPKF